MTSLNDLDRLIRLDPLGAATNADSLSPSLVGEAVRELRTAIMTGRLWPGQKLIEADIARYLDVSRASVREVLRALQGERLIELIPNRGPFVASLGAREVNDIEQVWAMLTGEAIARFAHNPKVSELRSLKRRLKSLIKALDKDGGIEVIDSINAFFWYIMQQCDNAVLLDVVVSLLSRLNFLRAQSLLDPGWRGACGREISDILTALEASDPAAARRAVVRHIASTCKAARAVAKTQADEAPGKRSAVVPHSPPVIPLDDYLDQGLSGRRGKRRRR